MFELLVNTVSNGEGLIFKGLGNKVPYSSFSPKLANKLLKSGIIKKVKKNADAATN